MTLRNLGCVFESVEKTHDILSQGRIICDGQGQLPFWPCKASGPLQDVVAQRCQFFKVPYRRSSFAGSPSLRLCPHLKFPSQIMGQDRSHQIQLIARKTPYRNVIHLALGPEFPEHLLLISSPVMKPKNLSHPDRLVCHNDRILISVGLRDEQVNWIGSLLISLHRCRMNKNRYRVFHLLGFQGCYPRLRTDPP